ncbi:alpha/beta hydrolase [Patescibacteria group bacterium]|nr:alpha/beta hydrolase [Patescibacteria group bacterium]
MEEFEKEIGDCRISVVAHSLGACALATKIEEIKDKVEKIVLIAPALNQKDLLRYWFVISQMEKSSPDIDITWQNYKEYLDENDFVKDCQRSDNVKFLLFPGKPSQLKKST